MMRAVRFVAVLSALSFAIACSANDDHLETQRSALLSTSVHPGFAWSTLTPSAATSYNSASPSFPSVTHTPGTGIYTLYFPNQGDSGGNIQVNPISNNPVQCDVMQWGPSGTDMRVDVLCFVPSTGQSIDSEFTVTLTKRNDEGTPRRGAYFTFNGSVVLSSTQWNSGGTGNSVHVDGVGKYHVKLPDQDVTEATPQVTGYGGNPIHCKMDKIIGATGGNWEGIVGCYQNGTPAYYGFSFSLANDELPHRRTGAYLHAEQPSTAGPYVCVSAEQRDFDPSMLASQNTSQRFSTGNYETDYSGWATPVSASSTMLVTAIGGDAVFCTQSPWSTSSKDELGLVSCFEPTTNLANDSEFTQLYQTSASTLP